MAQRPVHVYTFHGRFTGSNFKLPPGVEPVPGETLRLVVDDATGRVMEREIENLLPATASASSVRHRSVARRRHPRAHAAWNKGTGCEVIKGETHCYNIAEWEMSGEEQVKGTELQDETTSMLVPEGAASAAWFIDNEEWDAFPEKTNELGDYWIENGITSGNGKSTEALEWFVGWNKAGGYGETPGWPEEGWKFINFSMQEKGTTTEWCSFVEGNEAKCVSNLEKHSRVLNVGTEYVTPWTPVDNFNEQTNYTIATGETRRPWNKVTGFDKSEETFRAACSREEPPHYYPGNYSFWAPEWAHNSAC